MAILYGELGTQSEKCVFAMLYLYVHLVFKDITKHISFYKLKILKFARRNKKKLVPLKSLFVKRNKEVSQTFQFRIEEIMS